MSGTSKLIALCITKVHDDPRTEYIDALFRMAREKGYRIIVFNSFEDFYNDNEYARGAKTVYGIINYDLFDAVVILCDNFCDQTVVEKIADGAKAKNVPVVLVNGKSEGCYSITDDYRNAYKSIIRHVIADHHKKDTYFIAGIEGGDPISNDRLECYKEVLAEQGIPFREDRVGYGCFWEGPVNKIIDELTEGDRQPPQAIICANDYMAFAACARLAEHGYIVPDDVIVTGFDGVSFSEFHTPSITTCKKDYFYLAAKTAEMLREIFEGSISCTEVMCPFKAVIAESCGCPSQWKYDYRGTASALQIKNDSIMDHEDFMYTWIDRILEATDTGSLYSTISNCLLKNSYVCVKPDFMTAMTAVDRNRAEAKPAEEYVVISSSRNEKNEIELQERFEGAQMVPGFVQWMNSDKIDSVFILTAIHVGSDACGYYALRTGDLQDCGHKIHRIYKIINLGFNAAVSKFRQKLMKISLDNAAFTDHLTDLPNIKGTSKWFDEFSAVPENHRKSLAISVYALPKYKYIYENYGIRDIEESVCFVAESLKISNTSEDCFIGHISEDEFVIINYVDDPGDISNIINNAVSSFFGMIEGYNSTNGKDYFVEVNAGCTVINAGWNEDLASYIKIANNEMYVNRVKSGMQTPVEKEKAPAKYDYDSFDLLVKMNLFHYFFQPIISAETGEIYAYEALMRTDSSIGLNPLEVLEAAEKYNKLYEIERATMFNVMERYASQNEAFKGRKVFINSIPGYFLKEEDVCALQDKYGKYMLNFVMEITEQNTVSDDELATIRHLGGKVGDIPVAVDDYGTGHSNIVNLMRYSPEILKIDRFLMTDIDTDTNKQMFVKSTIEFARMNNIKVLAEGIETAGELRTVVEYGVDFIQGYYTGKPAPQPLDEISEKIRNEILEARKNVK